MPDKPLFHISHVGFGTIIPFKLNVTNGIETAWLPEGQNFNVFCNVTVPHSQSMKLEWLKKVRTLAELCLIIFYNS